jgi:hypothetical protein
MAGRLAVQIYLVTLLCSLVTTAYGAEILTCTPEEEEECKGAPYACGYNTPKKAFDLPMSGLQADDLSLHFRNDQTSDNITFYVVELSISRVDGSFEMKDTTLYYDRDRLEHISEQVFTKGHCELKNVSTKF